jgi:hypothetical protein
VGLLFGVILEGFGRLRHSFGAGAWTRSFHMFFPY